MPIKRSSTKTREFTTDELLNNHLVKFTQDSQRRGHSQKLSQKKIEGITLKPDNFRKLTLGAPVKSSKKSATASERINASVLVRRLSLLQMRKIVNKFPVMVRNERTHAGKNLKPGLRRKSKKKFLSTIKYK